jgi:RAB protein geranylgeranyltransferase component A
MNVKGVIYLTAKSTIIEAFGEEKWNAFVPKLTAKDKFFGNAIFSLTLIPMDKFIFFLDEMVKEFFNNDMIHYVTFGMVSAQYALSADGPYKAYILTKDIKQFVDFVMPKLWTSYFDEGTVTTLLKDNVVHFKITGLQYKHYHFEKLLMGYYKQALKVFGKRSNAKQVRSLVSGDDDIYFQFELKDS